jgi:N-acetylglutamate synthase-like GNAT family acetyltransferase
MDIEVRLAEQRDIEIIHAILEEIQRSSIKDRSKRLNEALDSNLSSYLVAVSAGKVIGFLNIWHLPDIVDGGLMGIVLDCYVSTEYRKQGVGEMLLSSSLELGKKFGVNKYYGWMAPGNKAAIALLKKFGFSTESLMLEKKS